MSRRQVRLGETATLCSEGRRTEEEGEREDERRVLEGIGVRSLHAVVDLSASQPGPLRVYSHGGREQLACFFLSAAASASVT